VAEAKHSLRLMRPAIMVNRKNLNIFNGHLLAPVKEKIPALNSI
jgi:hypothetical protein